MKNHFIWVMLLLDAYAIVCMYLLLTLIAEASIPEFLVLHGFLHR